jgi:hypothetical protein
MPRSGDTLENSRSPRCVLSRVLYWPLVTCRLAPYADFNDRTLELGLDFSLLGVLPCRCTRSSAPHTRRSPRSSPSPAGILAVRCARCFRLRKPIGPEALSSDPDVIRYGLVMSVSSKFHSHHIKRLPVLFPEVFHQGAGGAPGKEKKGATRFVGHRVTPSLAPARCGGARKTSHKTDCRQCLEVNDPYSCTKNMAELVRFRLRKTRG